jgi:hypothetical protein
MEPPFIYDIETRFSKRNPADKEWLVKMFDDRKLSSIVLVGGSPQGLSLPPSTDVFRAPNVKKLMKILKRKTPSSIDFLWADGNTTKLSSFISHNRPKVIGCGNGVGETLVSLVKRYASIYIEEAKERWFMSKEYMYMCAPPIKTKAMITDGQIIKKTVASCVRYYIQEPIYIGINDAYVEEDDRKQYPKRFCFLLEPIAIRDFQEILYTYKMFTRVFTFNKTFLTELPNAIWISPAYSEQKGATIMPTSPIKEFLVTMVVGSKVMAPGHILRHDIWAIQDLMTDVPICFYKSSGGIPEHLDHQDNPVLGSDKNKLYRGQFCIVVENSQQPGYFSEKIVDCFVEKTVPIYWGDPDIGDRWNTDGIITFSSMNELVDIVNGLAKDTYGSMKQAIDDNERRSQIFKDNPCENIASTVLKTIRRR